MNTEKKNWQYKNPLNKYLLKVNNRNIKKGVKYAQS